MRVPVLDWKVRRISWFTDLSRLPNRLDLIVAGPVDSGISLYDLLNEIKRESMMKIQSSNKWFSWSRIFKLIVVLTCCHWWNWVLQRLPASYAYMLKCVLCWNEFVWCMRGIEWDTWCVFFSKYMPWLRLTSFRRPRGTATCHHDWEHYSLSLLLAQVSQEIRPAVISPPLGAIFLGNPPSRGDKFPRNIAPL